MEEIIGEEEARVLSSRDLLKNKEIDRTPLHKTDNKPDEGAVRSTQKSHAETSSPKDESGDDYIDEDFEMISADELE